MTAVLGAFTGYHYFHDRLFFWTGLGALIVCAVIEETAELIVKYVAENK